MIIILVSKQHCIILYFLLVFIEKQEQILYFKNERSTINVEKAPLITCEFFFSKRILNIIMY